MSSNPIDVYVVGTGMVGTRQVTPEVRAAIEASGTAFLVHHSDYVEQYVSDLGTEPVDLTEEYDPDRRRRTTYERMAERVLDAAEAADEPVTMALYGHPMVFVSPSRWIVEEAPERDLLVEVRPGISSMDCLYVDLGLDPAANGIQMYEATDLLLREYDLSPEVPAMIWQVGVVESLGYDQGESAPGRFTRLREYLERFYPPDHEISLVQTATYPLAQSERITFELGEFESMHDRITATQTLYVPPVRSRPIRNEELAERIRSADHLETITR